ncbi:MAG: hypothetical protein SPG30_09910 [Peptostreptococcus porci]|nr:hypothetical protein [Peptostreptococcus porci]
MFNKTTFKSRFENYLSSSTVNRVLRRTEITNRRHHLPEVLVIDEFKFTKSVDASMSVIVC